MAIEGTCAKFARELGVGWKLPPSIVIKGNETAILAHIQGPGAIKHIWMTSYPDTWRSLIVRMYWDREEIPSVEVPIGDFFCNGWCERSNVNSLPVAVNPAGGMNYYWDMPFRETAKITIENLSPDEATLIFQIDYSLMEIPECAAYFHAQWRRSNPVKYKEVLQL
jgi:hypothetical protein